jgi:hypothetical protein
MLRTSLLVVVVLTGFACGSGNPSGTGGGSGGGGGGSGNVPPPDVDVTGAPENYQGTTFVMPAGMTEQVASDGVVLSGPKAGTQGSCLIVVLPPRAAEADLDAQMLATLKGFFAASFGDLRDPFGGTNPLDFVERGVSGEGWGYRGLYGFLTDLSNVPTGSKARILQVELGSTVVPIIGFEASDNLCLDNVVTGKPITWALFFHSLHFTGFTPSSMPTLAQQLLGKWSIGSGTVFLGETYAANGHYGTASAYQTFSAISPTEILQTTTSFFGDGTYEVRGNQLTFRPSNGRPASTQLFRIVEERNSARPNGWLPRLYKLARSIDNEPYETVITREMGN